MLALPLALAVTLRRRTCDVQGHWTCSSPSSSSLVLYNRIKFGRLFFSICVDWRLFATHSSTNTQNTHHKQAHKQTNKHIKSSSFPWFLRRRESWVPALLGSWFQLLCSSALRLSEHFIFVQPESEPVSPSSSSLEATVSTETQRKRQHAFDLLGERKKKKSTASKTIYPFL